jgi:uncharacterized membrane protein
MKSLLELLKSLLIGGIIFLLPIGIVLVVLGKLFAIASRLGTLLHDRLMPGVQSDWLVILFAVLVLAVIALVAGAIARTRLGIGTFVWLERNVLARLPIYTLFRQTIADMSGGISQLTAEGETEVVRVTLDDQEVVGFAVDRTPDGKTVVYLPGSPTPMSGRVIIVEPQRVTPLDMKPAQVFEGLQRLGAGLASLPQTKSP